MEPPKSGSASAYFYHLQTLPYTWEEARRIAAVFACRVAALGGGPAPVPSLSIPQPKLSSSPWWIPAHHKMGMPLDYTAPCWPKSQRHLVGYNDSRLTLVGNAWSIPVVAWLISCLGYLLGFCPQFSLQQIIQGLRPGGSGELQRLLLRPPLRRTLVAAPVEGTHLVKKLAGLVSIKGEDILLQSSSEQQVKYQRLRASVPAKLWRWKTIAGWSWTGSPEHINVLELRAIYTSIRWWVSQRNARSCRFVHLTDSLVCLHALSRGRSSSKKMRRTIAKVNSYLLACNLHPLWAYVHTSENPADKPSRRKVKQKWGK